MPRLRACCFVSLDHHLSSQSGRGHGRSAPFKGLMVDELPELLLARAPEGAMTETADNFLQHGVVRLSVHEPVGTQNQMARTIRIRREAASPGDRLVQFRDTDAVDAAPIAQQLNRHRIVLGDGDWCDHGGHRELLSREMSLRCSSPDHHGGKPRRARRQILQSLPAWLKIKNPSGALGSGRTASERSPPEWPDPGTSTAVTSSNLSAECVRQRAQICEHRLASIFSCLR
jgi:hypothetical protein